MAKTFLILGGYGNVGRLVAELLLQETSVTLVLAGRNLDKAHNEAERLNQKFTGQRVSTCWVDAADLNSLKTAFAKIDFVVVTASTIKYIVNVAEIALATGIDYLDVQLSTLEKMNALKSLESDIIKSGCCFITDGGFHPGMIATLVRQASLYLDSGSLEKAWVASVIQLDWKKLEFSEATLVEFVEELKQMQPLIFRTNQWQNVGFIQKKFDFGAVFNQRSCYPMFMEELRELPLLFPKLRELGFFVGGFNWMTDIFVIPINLILLKLMPKKSVKLATHLLKWSLKTFSKPPSGTVLLLEANGLKAGKPATVRIKLSHEDGYVLTAVPVVACLLQYLEGYIRRPGLWFQANIVESQRMLQDMERMGIKVEITF